MCNTYTIRTVKNAKHGVYEGIKNYKYVQCLLLFMITEFARTYVGSEIAICEPIFACIGKFKIDSIRYKV